MRRLGKTNINVCEIGLGGIPIQKLDSDTAKLIIKEMIKRGGNVIDTARGYTNSEELIGEALQDCREKVYIMSKSPARSYQAMKNDIKKSLQSLKTKYIDLYQFHNVRNHEEYNLIMSENGAYNALLDAQKEGLINHIGITSHSLSFLESIIDDFPFSTIQFPYNIVETQATALFERAAKNDIGVIVMKPLAGGAIQNSALALKFVLNNPNISVVIPGMESSEQVNKNYDVLGLSMKTIDYDEIELVRKVLDDDFCRRCGYCLPCTVGIDIPSCFTIESYYSRYSLHEWAYSRYNMLEKKAEDCIECQVCEAKCPYHIKISEKMKIVAEVFKEYTK